MQQDIAEDLPGVRPVPELGPVRKSLCVAEEEEACDKSEEGAAGDWGGVEGSRNAHWSASVDSVARFWKEKGDRPLSWTLP